MLWCGRVGKMNENGETFLSFCALNELSIMNMKFVKADVYKHTWQHPGTKCWHCIDFIVMRQVDRRLCFDVSVLRSAECWNDHKLLQARLRLNVHRHRAKSLRKWRFAVALLRDAKICSDYYVKPFKQLSDSWVQDGDGTSKWEVLRDRLLGTTGYVVGWE